MTATFETDLLQLIDNWSVLAPTEEIIAAMELRIMAMREQEAIEAAEAGD